MQTESFRFQKQSFITSRGSTQEVNQTIRGIQKPEQVRSRITCTKIVGTLSKEDQDKLAQKEGKTETITLGEGRQSDTGVTHQDRAGNHKGGKHRRAASGGSEMKDTMSFNIKQET